jgi:hypothetical protein
MIYKLINDEFGNFNGILKTLNGITTHIPKNLDNTDYQEYLEWTKASPMNVAEPADEVTG